MGNCTSNEDQPRRGWQPAKVDVPLSSKVPQNKSEKPAPLDDSQLEPSAAASASLSCSGWENERIYSLSKPRHDGPTPSDEALTANMLRSHPPSSQADLLSPSSLHGPKHSVPAFKDSVKSSSRQEATARQEPHQEVGEQSLSMKPDEREESISVPAMPTGETVPQQADEEVKLELEESAIQSGLGEALDSWSPTQQKRVELDKAGSQILREGWVRSGTEGLDASTTTKNSTC